VLRVRSLGLAVALAIGFAGPAIAEPAATDPTLATIDAGTVRGGAAGTVVAFKGIPYAQPPVGPLRWRAPQPVKSWPGVREAS
jgi:para-nitrobenzyl esterase